MANRKRSDVDTETALAVMQEERNLEQLRQEQQAEREQLIAKTHQMIGQIKAADMFGKFANVSSLVWLQQVKESKIYKDLPGVGTWESFCDFIGLSRQKVDLDLQNLATFGEEFLLTVSGLSVGYRDLRKLRQLTHDGAMIVDAEAVVIGAERIPLDADHREDLQAAIEKIIEEQAAAKEEAEATIRAKDKVLKSKEDVIRRQEKDLARFERQARAKEITPEEDAILGKIDELGVCLNGYALSVEAVLDAIQENPFNSAVAGFISLCDNIVMRVNAFRTAVVADLAPAGMLPDEEWTPPPLRETADRH